MSKVEAAMRETDFIPGHDDFAVASYDALKYIVTHHQFLCFVWSSDDDDDDPLLVDAFTASVVLKVHDSLSSDNQKKFERMITGDRSRFGRLVDFCWSCISSRQEGL